ncbi:MAG: hypothetical protein OXC13_06100 [Caldilineaceae bacterium]|nr:hypothetical protein [Caldilineaceae bacterium]
MAAPSLADRVARPTTDPVLTGQLGVASMSFGREQGRMDRLRPMLSRGRPVDNASLNSRGIALAVFQATGRGLPITATPVVPGSVAIRWSRSL